MGNGSIFVTKNIYQASIPFNYLRKLLGLGSYRINRWRCDIRTSFCDLLVLIIQIFVWVVLTILNITNLYDSIDRGEFKESNFLNKIQEITFTIQMLQLPLLIIFNHKRRRHIKKMLKSFDAFDRKLRDEHWPYKVKNSRTYFIFLVVLITTDVILSFLMQLLVPPDYVIILVMTFNNVVYIVVSIQFTLAIIAAIKRLEVFFANVRCSTVIMSIGSYFKAQNIFQASIPFNYLGKFFGLGTYSITDSECDIQSSIIDLVILSGTVLFWSSIVVHYTVENIIDGNKEVLGESDFLNQIQQIVLIIGILMTIFLCLFNHNRRHHIQNILKSLNDFDQKLIKEHWTFQIKCSRTYIVPLVIFMLIYVILSVLMKVMVDNTFTRIVLLTFNSLTYIVVSSQFIFAVIEAIKRMSILFKNVRASPIAMKISSYLKAQNIYQAAIPFHYLAKLFGLGTYRITSLECDIKSSSCDLVVLAGTVSFWTLLAAYHIFQTFGFSSKLDDNSKYLNQIQQLSLITVIACTIFYGPINHIQRRHIQTMLKSFDDFDQKLKNVHWTHQIKNSRISFLLLITSSAITIAMKISSYLKAQNVYQASIPFQYLTKCFGLGTYRITRYGCDIKSSCCDLAALAGTVLFWTFIAAFSIFQMITFDTSELDGNSNYLNRIQQLSSITSVVGTIFFGPFNHIRRRHIQCMLKSFNDFDKMLRKVHWTYQMNSSRIYFLYLVTFLIGFTILSLLMTPLVDNGIEEVMLLTFNNLNYIVVSSQFIFAVFGAIKRMNILFLNVR
ncbi:unnamed protein product [Chironomus riparius]|uniref:Uncharacterized protein n=1 Tax=Chironomus riparius TaxID=315576 RepID=A0A9N9S3C9_9DIPT|nr:unnamed protein product [Chironomus riparius]